MATKQSERQGLLHKIELLKLDLEYKTNAYIAAYSTLTKMAEHMAHVPAVQETITKWNEKDEALYQAWHEKRRETKRRQRARRKAELDREADLIRI